TAVPRSVARLKKLTDLYFYRVADPFLMTFTETDIPAKAASIPSSFVGTGRPAPARVASAAPELGPV
ncbi:hypothetical protein, partial [Streptomyces sp. IMTB 2501]|uniref:hypothetical protein n=1 Tax=Streptomyces sp. IMTB 2501 TaxID=1776340 RepID=UPI001C4C5485